jgi:hypothetical protein
MNLPLVSIWLTPTERTAILKHALTISPAAEKAIGQPKKSLPVVLPIQEWEDLAENLLAAANHADTPKLQRTLNRLEEKITSVVAVNEPAIEQESSITTQDRANIDASTTACWQWIVDWANTAEHLKVKQDGKLISYSEVPAIAAASLNPIDLCLLLK